MRLSGISFFFSFPVLCYLVIVQSAPATADQQQCRRLFGQLTAHQRLYNIAVERLNDQERRGNRERAQEQVRLAQFDAQISRVRDHGAQRLTRCLLGGGNLLRCARIPQETARRVDNITRLKNQFRDVTMVRNEARRSAALARAQNRVDAERGRLSTLQQQYAAAGCTGGQG